MQPYLDLLETILTKGRRREAPRNGSATLAVFGEQLRFDLSAGFPLVTTRKVPIRVPIEELIWFLSGSTNNEDLVAKNVHIWDQWAAPEDLVERTVLSHAARQALFRQSLQQADSAVAFDQTQHDWPSAELMDEHDIPRATKNYLVKKGSLGPIYGKMWRAWPNPDGTTTDQIKILIENLKAKAYSRRHVVVAWNPSFLPDESMSPIDNVYQGRQCLAACHTVFQFSVEPLTLDERMRYLESLPVSEFAMLRHETMAGNSVLDHPKLPINRLSCKLFARSQDVPLGTVSNLVGYAAFTMALAHSLNMLPGDYIHSCGDAHIYENQIALVKEQLKRQPRKLPTLRITAPLPSIFALSYDKISLEGYDPHPAISYPITV